MYMMRLKTTDDKNILVNLKDIRFIKECENQQATIEFLNGSWVTIECQNFDVLEQKVLDVANYK